MTYCLVPGKHHYYSISTICSTRSLGPLRAPTSSRRPFRQLDIVIRTLRALRPVRRARLRSCICLKMVCFGENGAFLRNRTFFLNGSIFENGLIFFNWGVRLKIRPFFCYFFLCVCFFLIFPNFIDIAMWCFL